MGGKGKRRREKNYKAAHGDHHTRLPPPPDLSKLDAVPSKLRKLFSFSNPDYRRDEAAGGGNGEKKRKRGGGGGGGAEEGKLQNRPSKDDDDNRVKFKGEDGDEARDDEDNNNKKKKRKRGQAEDLRFEASEGGAKYGDKRRERKKKFLEAKKKKKQKKKGANAEEESEFPGRERIRFGEVVQAPPKLVSIPKAAKKKVLQSAYKERLRLEVIDAYRQKRGWTNRPGLKLPSLDLTPAL